MCQELKTSFGQRTVSDSFALRWWSSFGTIVAQSLQQWFRDGIR